ncbi:mitochondrial nicotinamide adenine dinucleotide transporter SLC25A51-like [Mytilus edulis]|uniref:mitochondrial nicotinamide adenine dinucleotide transporter SLC25A51-like n=1 Tax=Mytilus edulis TaxID=6550 RepID=UPI0039EE2DE6
MKNHNMEEMLQKPGTISKQEMSTYIQSRNTKNYEEFICGWGAAFVNIGFTFPINKVMFRQQLHGVRVCKAVGQLQKEGMRHLYRGLLAPLLQKTTSLSLMFGAYYKIQHHLTVEHPSLPLHGVRIFSALTAGTLEAVLCPFERIQVLMQDRQYKDHFDNTAHAFKEVRKYGFREYYRGLSAVLLRNGPSNVPFFLFRDYAMENLPRSDSQADRISQDFFCGAVLGATLSTIFYPVNVVKVKMQCKLSGDFDSFWTVSKKVWIERDRKLKKLFRGVHINFTRSFISWGIINATYEFLMRNMFGSNTRLADSKS